MRGHTGWCGYPIQKCLHHGGIYFCLGITPTVFSGFAAMILVVMFAQFKFQEGYIESDFQNHPHSLSNVKKF